MGSCEKDSLLTMNHMNKQPSDWATPRPASARSVPSLNDPLDMIKRGIIKSDQDTSKIPSKEHAIDSSITSETGINTAKQNFSSQAINVHELPPKAHVQAITSDTYMHGVQRSQGFDSIEELKQGQPSELRYQCSESRFPEESLKKVCWATLRDNNRCPQPASMSAQQKLLNNQQDQISHNSKRDSGDCNYTASKQQYDLNGKKITNDDCRFAQNNQYRNTVQYHSQHQYGDQVGLNENRSLESVYTDNSKQSSVPSYLAVNANSAASVGAPVYYNETHKSRDSQMPYYNGFLGKNYKYSDHNSKGNDFRYVGQPSLTRVNALSRASSLNPVHGKDSLQSTRSGTWDHVMNAKDDLIRQKDVVIERQKQTISQMQQHINEIEERFNQNSFLLMSQRKEEEKYEMERKTSQCQISKIKAQLQNLSATKQEEIEKLQSKLGATEYELQKLQKGFNDVGRSKEKEVLELERKMEERDATDKKLKTSLALLQDSLKKEKRKVHDLEQYLHDLPTADEHKKSNQQIKELKSERLKLEENIESLEKLQKELKDRIKEKDFRLQEEQTSKTEFEKNLKRLSETLEKYKEREKDGPVTLEEYDEVKWENERLKAECERLKKLLEQKHKKMKALHQQSQNTTKALEERLGQEEDTINTLRRDIESKELVLSDLKISVKKISSENQDLMRENLALKDILSEFEQLTCREVQQAHVQVQKELSTCVAEIKYLIQLCSETAEGKDPNMSTLLGIKGHFSEDTGDSLEPGVADNPFGIEFAKIKLNKIRELRSEIDKLRTFVSDKYAEEVGSNCVTQ